MNLKARVLLKSRAKRRGLSKPGKVRHRVFELMHLKTSDICTISRYWCFEIFKSTNTKHSAEKLWKVW